MLSNSVNDRFERGFSCIVPEAEVAGRDAAIGFDCGGFEAEHAGAREREVSEVDHVPCGGFAAFG